MLRGWRKPWWACALALCLQCKDDEPRRGQLMVVLQTDMSIPKGVDRIRLQVLQANNLRHDGTYHVAPDGETSLPASLAIVAGKQPNETVEVRVIGIRGEEARVLSKAVTTVPRSRIAILRVPIQWLCVGELIEVDEDTYDTSCEGENQACVAGKCQPIEIEPDVLPSYEPEAIFGGGQAPGDPLGQCFDTELCFENGFDALPDADCSLVVDVPQNRELNLALKLSEQANDPNGEEGICGASGCFVPLDRDPSYGWTTREGSTSTDADGAGGERGQAGAGNQSNSEARRLRVALPEAVCDRISAKKVLAVRVSTSCQTKTPQYPTCGPWSSVGEALVSQGDTSASAAGGSTVSGEGGAGMNPTTTGAIASGGQTDSEMGSNSMSTTGGMADDSTPEAAGGATGFGGTTGSTTGSGGLVAGTVSTTGVMGGGGVTGSGAAAGAGGTTGSGSGGDEACMDSVSFGGAPPDGPQGCSATNCEGDAVSCAGTGCTCNGEALAEPLEPASCEPPATECCPDMALAWSACGFGSHDILSP